MINPEEIPTEETSAEELADLIQFTGDWNQDVAIYNASLEAGTLPDGESE